MAKDPTAITEPEPETLRGAIETAFDDVMGKDGDDEQGGSSELEDGGSVQPESGDEPEQEERSGESAGAETELGVEEEEGRIDEDDGPVDDDSDDEEDVEESDDDEGEDEEEDEEGREETEVSDLAAGPLEAPDFWPDEVKGEFKKMPPKAQEYYINSFKGMQADYTQKMQSIAEVKKAIDPVREELASTGVSEGEMIRRFVAVHKKLEDDPQAAIKWVSELYGVDINIPAGASTPETPADPRVDRIEAKVTAQERDAAIARAHAVNDEVNTLRKAGKMPLYAEAEETMIRVVAGLQQAGQPIPTVMEIYEDVVWRTPALRERHLATSEVEQKKRKIAEKKKNVAKSKRAAGKRRPSMSPTAGEKRKPRTLRQELSRRYDEALRD